MEPLEKLKKIVEILPDITPGNLVGNVLELDTTAGIGYCIGLKKNKMVAVADTVVSMGSQFIRHYHKEIEVWVMYSGHIQIITEEDGKKTYHDLEYGDVFRLEPNVIHNTIAIEDSKFIVITIPASEGFPEAK